MRFVDCCTYMGSRLPERLGLRTWYNDVEPRPRRAPFDGLRFRGRVISGVAIVVPDAREPIVTETPLERARKRDFQAQRRARNRAAERHFEQQVERDEREAEERFRRAMAAERAARAYAAAKILPVLSYEPWMENAHRVVEMGVEYLCERGRVVARILR